VPFRSKSHMEAPWKRRAYCRRMKEALHVFTAEPLIIIMYLDLRAMKPRAEAARCSQGGGQ
jgi:hypothetical protein